ncbi:MAG: tryptophan synthase subunit alpha [Candidatus Berkiella sp.]
MNRFKQCFATVANLKRPAYIPFLMLADPSPHESLRVINAVIESGIDALELGIPFSDPIADGPIVAQAAARACEHQLSTKNFLTMIQTIRENHPNLPIGILVYANLVFRFGINTFYQQAKRSGVDAVLIPDLPFLEAKPYLQAAKDNDVDVVLLATPSCQLPELENVATHSRGFTYLVTRPGVTGIDKPSQLNQAHTMTKTLQTLNAAPVVFGFGIKNALDVEQAYQAGAQGVIIGSALIEAIHRLNIAQCTSQDITELTRSFFVD